MLTSFKKIKKPQTYKPDSVFQPKLKPLPFIWSRPKPGSALPTPLASGRSQNYASRVLLAVTPNERGSGQPARCTWHFNPQGLSLPTVANRDRVLLPPVFTLTPAQKIESWRLFSATLSMPFPKNREKLRRLGGAVLCVVRTFLPERRQSGLRFFYFGCCHPLFFLKDKIQIN